MGFAHKMLGSVNHATHSIGKPLAKGIGKGVGSAGKGLGSGLRGIGQGLGSGVQTLSMGAGSIMDTLSNPLVIIGIGAVALFILSKQDGNPLR